MILRYRTSILPQLVVLGLVLTILSPTAFGQALEIAPEIQAAEEKRIAAIAKASQSTIAVFAANSAGGGGSGVVISPDGLALTNFHVTQPCGYHMSCGMNTGEIYDAVLVGIDPTGDLALIKLLGRDDFPTATIANSDRVQVGDECFAVGNPFLLATDMTPTVTYGVVSGVKRYQPPASLGILEYTDCIQTDAAINPGNSGGPLFDANGDLIGINGRGSFEKRGRVNVGVGYAISINQAMNFLGVLRSGRVVDHATLGATVSMDESGGVVVTNILASSDAYRRGLQYGDEIVTLAGRPIDSPNTFKNVLGILPRGWRVPITFRRDGNTIEKHVRLAGVHSPEILWRLSQQGGAAPPKPPAPDRPQRNRPDDEDDDSEPDRSEGDGDESDENEPSPDAKNEKSKSKNEAVEKLYQQRRGFANFYFNLQERARVWQQFSAASSLTTNETSETKRWELVFSSADDDRLSVVIDDVSVRVNRVGAQQENLVIDMTSNLSEARQPDESGGLYLSLFLLRRLLTMGPEQFGEVIYWGTAPIPGEADQFDVLLATHDVVESRFYFNRQSGQLRALEVFPDSEVDPCELLFDDFQVKDQGPSLPHTIQVKFGDDEFMTLKLESARFEAIPVEGNES